MFNVVNAHHSVHFQKPAKKASGITKPLAVKGGVTKKSAAPKKPAAHPGVPVRYPLARRTGTVICILPCTVSGLLFMSCRSSGSKLLLTRTTRHYAWIKCAKVA